MSTAPLSFEQFEALMHRATLLETELRVAERRIPFPTKYKSISPRAGALVMARLVASAASLGHALLVEIDGYPAPGARTAPGEAPEPPSPPAPAIEPETLQRPPAPPQEARPGRRVWAPRKYRRRDRRQPQPT